ncbi:MAG: CREG family protein, partial [Rhodospirillales bacterium]|nr:CREG family protein [Rhodospirillales bacterium]
CYLTGHGPWDMTQKPLEADNPFEAAASIISKGHVASLGSLLVNSGAPYVSLTTIAVGKDLRPVLLLSSLAEHTKNLTSQNHGSLLIEQASHLKNPQTGPRVTLLGTIDPTQNDVDRELFLSTHPSAKAYAGFGDFNFYKMSVDKVHFVGGFGAAHWFSLSDLTK